MEKISKFKEIEDFAFKQGIQQEQKRIIEIIDYLMDSGHDVPTHFDKCRACDALYELKKQIQEDKKQ